MIAAWLLFSRLVVRPLWREPLRTALTTLAVALGVSVVIAIDLASQSATESFHSSVESLVGKNDLLLSTTGGLNDELLGRLEQLPYAFHWTPRIEDYAFVNGRGSAIPLFGVDLVGYANTHPQDASAFPSDNGVKLEEGNPLWAGDALGLHKGQRIHLLINERVHMFTIAGIIPAKPGEGTFLIVDIGLAQSLTGKLGKLDSIDVQLPAGMDEGAAYRILQSCVPPTVSINPQGARTEENRKMMSAFRWNLHVLSYIALLVGAFLIYNTVSISVVRRRNEIGVIRALGASAKTVLLGVLCEALFFAVVGSAVGVLLGRVLAIGALALVGNTVQMLYVASQSGALSLQWGSVLNGVALGTGVSILAALAPAWEASRVLPVEAMARGRNEYQNKVRSRLTVYWALALLVAAAALAQLPPIYRQPIFAYAAVLCLVAGFSLLIPNIVLAFSRSSTVLLQKLLGVEAVLGMRSLRASLGRTSVLTAALTTAVAMTAAVGLMVGSFRATVSVWMNNELKADFYLRPAGESGADRDPTMGAAIADDIEKLPGVAAVDRYRGYAITYQGMPAVLAGGESSKVEQWAGTLLLPGENAHAIFQKLPAGNYALVSEPFANKHNVHPGSVLELPLGSAIRKIQVLGITYDYSTERGYIVMDRRVLLRYLPDPAVSSLSVYLAHGANPQAVRSGIEHVLAGRAVIVLSNSQIRRAAIAIFDQTFRITYALEAVAVLVAVLGIAGALLALVLDRRREFALLRFLGAARGQVRRIILCEAGLLGLFANAIGLVLGVLLSLILIFVINKQSFGWTIQFHWPVRMLLSVLSGIYVATLLAGLYPARTAVQMNPIEVIHEE